MKEGANPEMQGLRGLVSGRLQAQADGPHPDPDVLAAFAENALLEAERAQLLQHLGACRDCREILYLAASSSAEEQKVLSFQPKRSRSLVFRWGALAASVVIVGVAVISRESHQFRLYQQSATVAKSSAPKPPEVSNSAKLAEERSPAEVETMRDKLEQKPARDSRREERPRAKHMTAKPAAKMDFDDSDQVRIAHGVMANQSKKQRSDDLSLTARNVAPITAAPDANEKASPAVAGRLSKDTTDSAGSANSYLWAARATANGGLDGTVLDRSGAVIGNARVTVSGAKGEQAVTSDAEGKFRFDSLTPGTYSIKTEASGFKSSEIREVAVLDNRTSTVGVRLETGNVSETVEVNGAAVAKESAAAAPPAETTNGYVSLQKQVAQAELQKAVATNAPSRAKAAIPTPQWTLSADGSVQRSFDRGKNWQKVTVASGTTFRALCAVGQHVWAGGSAGLLYHSVDSGTNWVRVEPSIAERKLTLDVMRIEFFDPLNGSVSTSSGEVWTTSDGGITWRLK